MIKTTEKEAKIRRGISQTKRDCFGKYMQVIFTVTNITEGDELDEDVILFAEDLEDAIQEALLYINYNYEPLTEEGLYNGLNSFCAFRPLLEEKPVIYNSDNCRIMFFRKYMLEEEVKPLYE